MRFSKVVAFALCSQNLMPYSVSECETQLIREKCREETNQALSSSGIEQVCEQHCS